jgi:transcriptional regulator with XRE-family HTH domain
MNKLKKYLIENKIKPAHFAKKINYSKGNLSRILNGKLLPSYRIAFLIEQETK